MTLEEAQLNTKQLDKSNISRNRSISSGSKEYNPNASLNNDVLFRLKKERDSLHAEWEQLEKERQNILKGHFQRTTSNGGVLDFMAGGAFSEQANASALENEEALAPATPAGFDQLEENLLRSLETNPLVARIYQAFQARQELEEEMVLGGELPDYSRASSLSRAVVANHRLNVKITRKSPALGGVMGSSWLLAAGLTAFLLFFAGLLLPALPRYNGNNSGSSNSGTTKTITPARSRTPVSGTGSLSVIIATPGRSSQPVLDTARNSGAELISFSRRLPLATSQSQDTLVVLTEDTPSPATSPAPATTIPASETLEQEEQPRPATPTNQEQNDQQPVRVGQPPQAAGGFNGPHGAFLAPSHLKVSALGIDVPILKALVEEQSTQQESPGTTLASPETASPSPDPTSVSGSTAVPTTTTTPAKVDTASISWPRPGLVVQSGAYPGEVGNMLIMGNLSSLAALRRLQLNDLITITDRQGSTFYYRVVPFSPLGEAEREIDPVVDSWVFGQETGGAALLTIITNLPRPAAIPLTATPNPNPDATTLLSEEALLAKDDFLSSHKLAYRAVLAVYAPATPTPQGTLVEVPDSVYRLHPAATSTPTLPASLSHLPSPAAGETAGPSLPAPATVTVPAAVSSTPAATAPAPTPVVPLKMPDTGMGGAAPLTSSPQAAPGGNGQPEVTTRSEKDRGRGYEIAPRKGGRRAE
ncbi:MAG TPA: hypothetical protein VH186_09600 [Chloroflexia bacterium]|nr:hypothetical protein [Chloroflexia bacterium]